MNIISYRDPGVVLSVKLFSFKFSCMENLSIRIKHRNICNSSTLCFYFVPLTCLIQTSISQWKNKTTGWSQSIISSNHDLQNSMKVRLSNINCQLAFQHASSAILTRQTADRWSNTRGWRSHEVFKINAVWITIRFRWYFSILQPTLQLSFMIPALFKQEHSTVKNSRYFESRIAKIPTKNFSSSNFRQAFLGSPPARIYGQDDVVNTISRKFSYEILYMCLLCL